MWPWFEAGNQAGGVRETSGSDSSAELAWCVCPMDFYRRDFFLQTLLWTCLCKCLVPVSVQMYCKVSSSHMCACCLGLCLSWPGRGIGLVRLCLGQLGLWFIRVSSEGMKYESQTACRDCLYAQTSVFALYVLNTFSMETIKYLKVTYLLTNKKLYALVPEAWVDDTVLLCK